MIFAVCNRDLFILSCESGNARLLNVRKNLITRKGITLVFIDQRWLYLDSSVDERKR